MTPANPLFNSILWNQAAFGGNISGLTGETAGGLIYAALRKAGITLGPGRTPSPAQMQDALDELRRLTGSLNCDRLFIYAEDTFTFPIVTSQTIYTWGQVNDSSFTADFDAPRPQLITRANYLDSSSLRYPIGILTPQAWAAITSQDLPNTIPQGLYNDRAYPISNIYFYGRPQAGMSVEIWAWHQVPIYTSEGDAVILPLQYEDALVLNLACRLAPHFQRQLDPVVMQQARESLMRLESINAPQPVAALGFGCCSDSFNIYQG
jgi:hypothetical protein